MHAQWFVVSFQQTSKALRITSKFMVENKN